MCDYFSEQVFEVITEVETSVGNAEGPLVTQKLGPRLRNVRRARGFQLVVCNDLAVCWASVAHCIRFVDALQIAPQEEKFRRYFKILVGLKDKIA